MTNSEEQIRQTVLDYFEGWFQGDVARLDGALHPELVKRAPGATLGVTTKQRMLDLAGTGQGAEDVGDGRVDVSIHDVHQDIATVTVRGGIYHEYLHLVRTGDRWKIANTLWQLQ